MSLTDIIGNLQSVLLYFVPGFLLIQTYRFISGRERAYEKDRLIVYSIVVSFVFGFSFKALYEWIRTWINIPEAQNVAAQATNSPDAQKAVTQAAFIPDTQNVVAQAIIITIILVICIILGLIIGKTDLPGRLSRWIGHRTQEGSCLLAFTNSMCKDKKVYVKITVGDIEYTGQGLLFPEDTGNEFILVNYFAYDIKKNPPRKIIDCNPESDDGSGEKSYLYIKADDVKTIQFTVCEEEKQHAVLDYFLDVAFDAHDTGDRVIIRRWGKPILLEVKGRHTRKDTRFLKKLVEQIMNIEGMPKIGMVSRKDNEEGNNIIHFASLRSLPDLCPGYKRGKWDCTYASITDKHEIDYAISGIANEITDQRKRNNLILKCLIHSLGLFHDINKYKGSIFYDKRMDNEVLSHMDILMIRMLYSQDVRAGMGKEEAQNNLKLWLDEQPDVR